MMKENMSASKPKVSQTIPKKKVMSRCSVSSKSVHDMNKQSLPCSSWTYQKIPANDGDGEMKTGKKIMKFKMVII